MTDMRTIEKIEYGAASADRIFPNPKTEWELLERYIAFDTETTGLDPDRDHIVEVGAVVFEHGAPVSTFQSYVYSGISIPQEITALNHITNEMLKSALRDYFQEHTDYLERMVAAYVLGYSFTAEDLVANPALKFAEGADDVGVIVSWNTEGPGNKHEYNSVVKPNAFSINPLNWKRDETYAPASENLGDRLPDYDETGINATDYQVHTPGLADAQLDVERGVVVCTTMPDRYVKALAPGVPNVFGPASLHTGDYPNYWENIRENVRTRTKAYYSRK